jgi:hypothetical protein
MSIFAACVVVGLSMAVADGLLSEMDEFWAVLQIAPVYQLLMQPFVITWTLVSTFLLRRIFKSSLNAKAQN